MNETGANGTNTYYSFSEGNSTGTYLLTIPDGTVDYNRLQIDNTGAVKMTGISSTGSWVSFTITEATSSSKASSEKATLDLETSEADGVLYAFPNPVKDILNVKISGSKTAKLDVINFAGQRVLSQDIKEASTVVDVSNLASGIYIIKVTDEQQHVQTKKIIKK